jgi:hypothetical protein
MRRRLLDALGDTLEGSLWDAGRPSYATYLRRNEWLRIKSQVLVLFRRRCWVCARGQRELEQANSYLTTAHIVYPAEPFTEVLDTDLTRSDVVLLCLGHHIELDDWARLLAWPDVDSLRREFVQHLLAMRLAFDDA